MIVVPFISEHLNGFEVHNWQRSIAEHIKLGFGDMIEDTVSYTCLHEGKVIFIAGVYDINDHRKIAWALVGKDASPHLLYITKKVREFLDSVSYDRIETLVQFEFEQGHRWARMLGFNNETPDGMMYYGDNGENFCMYSRVRNG